MGLPLYIYSPIPTIDDEFKLLWRGFVLEPQEPGGSGARRCGVLGISHLKIKAFNDFESLSKAHFTLERKSVFLVSCTTFEVVALLVGFELTALGTRCSSIAFSMMYSTVDREEVFDLVSVAMASAAIRCSGTTYWNQRPLSESSTCWLRVHVGESPELDALSCSCDQTWCDLAWKWQCSGCHAKLLVLRAMAMGAMAETRHCPFRGWLRLAMRATVRSIAATKASPWHFQIYEHPVGIPAVESLSPMELAQFESLHATRRWYCSRSDEEERVGYRRCPLHPPRLAVPARGEVLTSIHLKADERKKIEFKIIKQKLFSSCISSSDGEIDSNLIPHPSFNCSVRKKIALHLPQAENVLTMREKLLHPRGKFFLNVLNPPFSYLISLSSKRKQTRKLARKRSVRDFDWWNKYEWKSSTGVREMPMIGMSWLRGLMWMGKETSSKTLSRYL